MDATALLDPALQPYLWALLGAAVGLAVGAWLGAGKYRRALGQARDELEHERARGQQHLDAMEQRFAELSHNALERNNRMFLELAQQSFGRLQTEARGDLALREQAVADLVRPIRESLDHTRREIQQLERDRRQSHGDLTRHLASLVETQQALEGETRNLVQALRRPEVRGRWGELTLRRLAELAGMVEHCDFTEQVSGDGDDRRRPDMTVQMPAGRRVVVDVKTPLDAYLSAVEATDPDDRDGYLRRHARQVRERVLELAGKRYWEQFSDTPEFVVLFIPGDQFLSAALDQDPSLLEDALSRKVILATPTSFVALLRAIAYGWRQDALNRNAGQIRRIGEDLYHRLGTLAEHMTRLGRQLDSSVAHYNRLVGSFDAKVMPGARRFTELGVTAGDDLSAPEPVEKQARSPAQESSPNESE